MHVRSVQRLPIPQFGQRFSPSVDVPNGLSRDAASRSRRCRRLIVTSARAKIATEAMSSRIWDV